MFNTDLGSVEHTHTVTNTRTQQTNTAEQTSAQAQFVVTYQSFQQD
jgi:hypothetical protein